ncbi:MAG: DUF3112 domain-containing protein [Bacilli bacterium]|nr:DUF3112 domain-containing protein [Bacilli bacterium]
MAFMGILLINAILWVILLAVLADVCCLIAFIVFFILTKKYSSKKWIRITRNVVGIAFVVLAIPLILLFFWLKPDKKDEYHENQTDTYENYDYNEP